MFDFIRGLGRKSVDANVLLIIDMQNKFLEPVKTYQPIIEATVDHIHYARKHGEFIVIVEYDFNTHVTGLFHNKKGSPTEPTHRSLIEALGDYDRFTYVFKGSMGGGNEVLQALQAHNVTHDKFKVCGVYAPWCVKETVTQLRNLLPNSHFHLLKDSIAAANNDTRYRDDAFNEMTFYDTVTVA